MEIQSVGEQSEPQGTVYEMVGGHTTFVRLVDAFYNLVATNEILRPLYPEEDLTGANLRLRMFLEQYWGGPRTYNEKRGHPRLRIRHEPFAIGDKESKEWLNCMNSALDSVSDMIYGDNRTVMDKYFMMAAFSLQNAVTD